jgi:hypothetical protein
MLTSRSWRNPGHDEVFGSDHKHAECEREQAAAIATDGELLGVNDSEDKRTTS